MQIVVATIVEYERKLIVCDFHDDADILGEPGGECRMRRRRRWRLVGQIEVKLAIAAERHLERRNQQAAVAHIVAG